MLLAAMASFVLTTAATAQQAPAPAEPSTEKAKKPIPVENVPATAVDEEVIELSPFVVNTSADVGYNASNSLGGIGINTKLTDIGSSVSVVTSKFLEDTGSYNLRDMLIYQTSAEATGFGGNLSGANGGSSEPDLGNGNSGTRIRGLAAADQARNYFKSIIPMDGFNTDRVEINRGANALLFGTGSPAGIINTGTVQANLNKQYGKIDLAYGTYGTNRESITYNYVPLKGELAVGVSALLNQELYKQKFAYSNSDRQYITVGWDPKELRNKGIFSSTTVRANFEQGKIKSNRPRVLTPSDRYSSWFEDSVDPQAAARGAVAKGAYDPTGVNKDKDGIASNTSFNTRSVANGLAGLNVIDNVNRAPVFFFQNVNDTIPLDNIQSVNTAVPNIVQGTVTFPSLIRSSSTIFGRPMVVDDYQFPAENANARFTGSAAIPARKGTAVGVSSLGKDAVLTNYSVQDAGFYKGQNMNDASVFDFFSGTLIGPNSEAISNFKAFDASIQQLMFNRTLGLEVSVSRQTYDESLQSLMPSGSPYISIDANTRMWTGEVNPNFGRPFTSTPGLASYTEKEIETLRAKVFYELDLNKKIKNSLGWVLGKHVLSGLVQRERQDSDTRTEGSVFYTPDYWPAGNGQWRGNNAGTRLSTWFYLGDRNDYTQHNAGKWFSAPTTTTLSGAHLLGVQQNIMNLDQTVNGNGYLYSRLRPVAIKADASKGIVAQSVDQLGLLPDYQVKLQAARILREDRELTHTAGKGSLSDSRLDSQAVSLQSNWLGDTLVSTIGLRKEKSVARSLVYSRGTYGGTHVDFSNANYTLTPVAADDPRYSLLKGDLNYPEPRKPDQQYSDTLFAWSLVAKAPPKLLRYVPAVSALNVYAGKSENFIPPTAQALTVFGAAVPPPQGSTKEFGIYLGGFKDLITARINFFETTQSNVRNNALIDATNAVQDAVRRAFDTVGKVQGLTGGPTSIYGTAASPTNPAPGVNPVTFTPANIAAINNDPKAAAKDPVFYPAGFVMPPQVIFDTYNIQLEVRGSTVAYNSSDPGVVEVGDVKTKGTELEVQIKPTKGLSLTMNVAKTIAVKSNSGKSLAKLLFQTPVNGDTTLVDEWVKPYNGSIPLLSTLKPTDYNSPTQLYLLNNYAQRSMLNPYNVAALSDGGPTSELRKWRANATTKYAVQSGMLKGVEVGGSVRWEQKSVIGFPVRTFSFAKDAAGVLVLTPKTDPDVIGSDGLIVLDINSELRGTDVTSPIYGKDNLNFDAFVAYGRKIYHGKVDWRIQLNVRNIGVGDKLIPTVANPDGSIAAWSIAEPQRLTLSTRFSF